MTDGFNFKLSSPLTKEDWNKICDAELEHTKKIVYKTPSGKEVTFISLAELEEIKAEIRYNGLYNEQIEEIIDKHINQADCNNDCEHCEWTECPKD